MNEPTSLDRAAKVSVKRTSYNALSNYAYYGLQVVILLALQAFIVRQLGRENYAIWPVLRSCINVVGLIQIGIGYGAGRFIAVAIGKRDEQDIQRIVSTFFAAMLVGAVLYFGVVMALVHYLEQVLEVPEAYVVEARRALAILGVSGSIHMAFSVFTGVLTATQSFIKLNVLRSGLLILRAVVVVGSFLAAAPSLVWIAIAHLCVSVVEAAGCLVLAKSVLPWLRVTLRAANWKTFREVNAFSLFALLTAIAGKLYWDTDNVIINKMLDPALVTGYAVVTVLMLRCVSLTSLANNALATPITVMHGEGQTKRIVRAIYRANRIAVPAGVFPLIFFMFFGGDFIVVYVGEEYREFAYLFPLIGIGFTISSTQGLPGRVPGAVGKLGLPALMTFVFALVNIVLSLIFVHFFKWGLAGVAGGTILVQLLYRATFYPVYVAHLLNEPVSRFFWKTVVIPLGICIPVALCFALLKWSGQGGGLWGLALVCAIGVAVHFTVFVTWGLDPIDRKKMLGLVAALRVKTGRFRSGSPD